MKGTFDGRAHLGRRLLAAGTLLLLTTLSLLPAPGPTWAEWGGGHCAGAARAASRTWFFAEGCTRPGFDEWICVLNPSESEGEAKFRFLLPGGEGVPFRTSLKPRSRLTLYVNQAAGNHLDVSVILESDIPVVAERPMYFRYGNGGWAGGHREPGAPALSTAWLFAEGCTRPGFDTWLCVANPHPTETEVGVDFMLGAGQGENASARFLMPPGSRLTLRVGDFVPPGLDVSMRVTSSQPVVAERPMYFEYRGGWDGGHVALGSVAASNDWYFAEGCTRQGFEEWVCLLNPGEEQAHVSLDFISTSGELITLEVEVPARRRHTVYVNQVVGPERDVSCQVTSNTPVVAERPLYFAYPGNILGGHITAGVTAPSREMYFSEGCTLRGFDDYLCVMNPNRETVGLQATFLGPTGLLAQRRYELPPRSRLTLSAREVVGLDKEFSVSLASDLPVVAEKPIYFAYRPLSTCTLACVGDVNLDLDQFDLGYGYEYPWTGVVNLLQSADLAFANLECAVSYRGSPVSGKSFTFRGSPAALPAMRNAGIDVVSHANNHARDYGAEALVDTLHHLENNGIAHCGSGVDHNQARSPTFLAGNGLRVAFLAYSDVNYYGWPAGPGYPGVADASDPGRIATEISTARQRSDLVVVSFHWGEEKEYHPTSRQRYLAHLAVDSGADIVLGHHPHVVQGLEIYRGRLIAYSLGNFVFNPGSVQGTYSVLLRVSMGCGEFRGATLNPVRIVSGRPSPMSGSEATSWLRQIASLCASLGTPVTLHGDTASIP
ncbi:MAG: DUF5719 family protein [Actinomycetota bacterium]